MRKINAEKIVCTHQQTVGLMNMGIIPAAHYCYEPADDSFEFGGEYVGQEGAIPAWTLEELNVFMGGDFAKPDLLSKQEWRMLVNMLQYVVYYPEKSKYYPNGAEAAAASLEYLLINKMLTAEECNNRMDHFIEGKFYNPLAS